MKAVLRFILLAALLLPPVLSFLLLAAHFMRARGEVAAGITLLPLILFAVRRPWAARVMQVILLLGALEWVRTVTVLVDIRVARGLPWERMAIILGAAALFTALSVWMFELRPLRRWFGRTGAHRDVSPVLAAPSPG